MIAPELLNEIKRLNREEKIQVIQFLNDELSDDIDEHFEGARVFKVPTLFVASDEAISMIEKLEDEARRSG